MLFRSKKANSALAAWLPLAVTITLLCGLIYATAQQVYRQSLNDPQIQLAEDAVAALKAGKTPVEVVGQAQVDIRHSLAPYLIIFNASGQPVASSARLDGKTPSPPSGVFDFARGHDRHIFSWEPKPGVRSAAVLILEKFDLPNNSAVLGRYVLAGRSMDEVEKRESALTQMVFLGWLVTLAGSLVAVRLSRR